MAELITNKDLDDTKKPQQQNAVPGMVNGVNTSNQQPNQVQQSGQQQKRQGTGFTNIGRILQANQGNRLGQAVGGGIQNTVQTARTNLQNQQNVFGQQIQQQKNIIDQDQQMKNQALQQLSGNDSADAYDALANKAQDFARIREGAYYGPNSLENPETLRAQAQDASFLGNAVNQAGGRQVLLQRFAGNPQYTQGQQRIDNLLLGKQLDPLRRARQQAIGLSGQTDSQISAAEALGKGTQAEKTQLAQQTAQGLTDTQNAFQTDLTNRVNQTKQQQDNDLQRYKDILSGKALADDSEIQRLKDKGLNLEEGFYGIDPTEESYLNRAVNVNDQTVAGLSDYAKYGALNKLLGQNGTLLTDRTQAGLTSKGPLVDLDAEQALKEINANKELFNAKNKGYLAQEKANKIFGEISGYTQNLVNQGQAHRTYNNEMQDLNSFRSPDFVQKLLVDPSFAKQQGLEFDKDIKPEEKQKIAQDFASKKASEKEAFINSTYGDNQRRSEVGQKLAQAKQFLEESGQVRGGEKWNPYRLDTLGSYASNLAGGNIQDLDSELFQWLVGGSANATEELNKRREAAGANDSFMNRQAALRKLQEQQNAALAPTVGT